MHYNQQEMNKIKILNADSLSQMRATSNQFRVAIPRPFSALTKIHQLSQPSHLSEQQQIKNMIKKGITPERWTRNKTLRNLKTQPSKRTKIRFYKTELGFSHEEDSSSFDPNAKKNQKQKHYLFEKVRKENKNELKVEEKKFRTKTEVSQKREDLTHINNEIKEIIKQIEEQNSLFQNRKSKKMIEMNRMKFGKYWMKHKLGANQNQNTRKATTNNTQLKAQKSQLVNFIN